MVDELAANGHGLIMVMGKGGVGKTTIAAALAIGLVMRSHAVHLSTTDPAAHLAMTLEGALPGLDVGRIDPQLETQRYIDKIMTARSAGLSRTVSSDCSRVRPEAATSSRARRGVVAGLVERTVSPHPKTATAVGIAPRQIRMRRIR